MRRTRAQDNLATLPAPIDTGAAGYYSAGPPATVFSVDDANIIQEELVALATVKGASLDTAGTTVNQCAKAVESPSNLLTGSSGATGENVSSVWTNGILASISSQAGTDSSTQCVVIAALYSKVTLTGSAIVGGMYNTCSSNYSVVAAGQANIIKNDSYDSFIGGGYSNIIDNSSYYSFIGGGYDNTIDSGSYESFIGGGEKNTIQNSSNRSFIGTGYLNLIGSSSYGSFIGGGQYNTIQSGSYDSVIEGGINNSIDNSSYESFIGGGYNNTIDSGSRDSFIGGGYRNIIDNGSYHSFIGGGDSNIIDNGSYHSFIGGGYSNIIDNGSYHSFIGGGYSNYIHDTSQDSFIGAGAHNVIQTSSNNSAIVGGSSNTIQDNSVCSFIGGGLENNIQSSSQYCFIGGGNNHSILGANNCAAILGGYTNIITGSSADYALIGGGNNNLIKSTTGSVILGSAHVSATVASNVVVVASRYVNTYLGSTSSYTLCGGYNATTGSAPTWRINSVGGIIHATNTTVQALDYAELFINLDGIKHLPGRLLTRSGKGVKLANSGHRVVGVVSVCPNVIGGSDMLGWAHQWSKDEWGATIWEEVDEINERVDYIDENTKLPHISKVINRVMVRKVNPDFDQMRSHIPRTSRSEEWTVVGLLGQIRVAIDSTVKEDDFIIAGNSGIGTRSDLPDNGRKIECMQIEIPYDNTRGYGIALCLVG